MADFPLNEITEVSSIGYDLATQKGIDVTSSASTNTKGAFVEILSAANNLTDSCFIEVIFNANSPISTSDNFVDIAIGGAGSEEVIINNIFTQSSFTDYNSLRLPISIPAGQRISARSQASSGSTICNVRIKLYNCNFKSNIGYSEVIAIGATEASTSGVLVSFVTANVFSGWVEVTAATSNNFSGIAVASHRGSGSWTNGVVTYELGLGSAGNEISIIGEQMLPVSASETGTNLLSDTYMIPIPEGSRLSIRATANSTGADFHNEYVLYGVK